MNTVTECPFCQIFAGKVEVRRVFEGGNVLGIVDVQPRFALGQCLVIPKKHVEQFYELDDDEVAELFKAVKAVANKIKKAFAPPFVCIVSRGQTIPHAHIIVFPSSPYGVLDGFMDSLAVFHSLSEETSADKLDNIAQKIRNA